MFRHLFTVLFLIVVGCTSSNPVVVTSQIDTLVINHVDTLVYVDSVLYTTPVFPVGSEIIMDTIMDTIVSVSGNRVFLSPLWVEGTGFGSLADTVINSTSMVSIGHYRTTSYLITTDGIYGSCTPDSGSITCTPPLVGILRHVLGPRYIDYWLNSDGRVTRTVYQIPQA